MMMDDAISHCFTTWVAVDDSDVDPRLPQEAEPQGVRAMLLIVKLSPVQF